jgi:membrane protein YqaA with SNARE-associated domain
MAEAAAPSRTLRTVLALDRAADRPWFLPAVSLFPLADYVLPFLPNQMLLAALSVLQPRRWLVFAALFVAASASGAVLTAWAVQALGPWLLETIVGGAPERGAAADLLRVVERYGLAGLILLAALPWPPRTAVIVCALAGLPPLTIGLAVALGRTVPAGLLAIGGAKAPHVLRRVRSVDRLLSQLEACRTVRQ